MLLSISVSFTNKHVNHTEIFGLEKLLKNNKMDEIGAKMTGLVSIGNLDSGKSNVPIDNENIYFNREVTNF
jgi:hypothetical protein